MARWAMSVNALIVTKKACIAGYQTRQEIQAGRLPKRNAKKTRPMHAGRVVLQPARQNKEESKTEIRLIQDQTINATTTTMGKP